jgi:hypothetical protein
MVGVGRGFVVAGADGGEPLGDAVGGGDEEVAGSAGGVANANGEQAGLGRSAAIGVAVGAFDGGIKDGIEGAIEQAIDEAGGRVVTAGGFAFVAGGGGEFESVLGEFGGMEFEERFVDAAKLFWAEVAVIDGGAPAGG